MTLFVLILIIAVERVTVKSDKFHVTTFAQQYFSFIRRAGFGQFSDSTLGVFVIACLPAIVIALLLWSMPLLLDFVLMLVVLWMCLGCPDTRLTYKQVLQAAARQDLQACSLHSMSLGNYSGELSKIGQHLVLINYRQYVSIILFFVVTGLPGLAFYSVINELSQGEKQKEQRQNDATPADSLLFYLDWLPVRIATFGFVVVGHFSRAFGAWAHAMTTPTMNTDDILTSVSTAAEDVIEDDNPMSESLVLVQLVKRNIVLILTVVAIATMVGLVS